MWSHSWLWAPRAPHVSPLGAFQQPNPPQVAVSGVLPIITSDERLSDFCALNGLSATVPFSHIHSYCGGTHATVQCLLSSIAQICLLATWEHFTGYHVGGVSAAQIWSVKLSGWHLKWETLASVSALGRGQLHKPECLCFTLMAIALPTARTSPWSHLKPRLSIAVYIYYSWNLGWNRTQAHMHRPSAIAQASYLEGREVDETSR